MLIEFPFFVPVKQKGEMDQTPIYASKGTVQAHLAIIFSGITG